MLSVFGLGTAALSSVAEAQFRFGEPDQYVVSREARRVLLVDLDNDALPDAVVGIGSALHMYFNAGGGLLVPDFILPVPSSPLVIAAGDLDGDGYIDLVWTDRSHTVYVFYNRGDGRGGEIVNTGATGTNIAVADLDGDGLPDIVFHDRRSASVEVLFSRGRGEFEHRTLYTHPDPDFEVIDLVSGDVDGDGDVDVAVMYARFEYTYYYYYRGYTAESELVFLANEGGGEMRELVRWLLPWRGGSGMVPRRIAAGDLDGDGDLDFVISAGHFHDPFGTVHAFRNDGERLMQLARWSGDQRTTALHIVDLDLDGRPDVVHAGDWLGGWAARNLGEGRFDEPSPLPGPPFAMGADLADVYGNGQWDLAFVGQRELLGPWYLWLVENLSFTDGPHLFHNDLTRGRTATFAVRDAEPGERVHFLYSLTGAGHTRGQPLLGGIVLDLLDPIVHFGSATADANGNAILRRTIPPNAPLTTVVTQAVIRRGPGGADSVKTPFRTARIEEN